MVQLERTWEQPEKARVVIRVIHHLWVAEDELRVWSIGKLFCTQEATAPISRQACLQNREQFCRLPPIAIYEVRYASVK